MRRFSAPARQNLTRLACVRFAGFQPAVVAQVFQPAVSPVFNRRTVRKPNALDCDEQAWKTGACLPPTRPQPVGLGLRIVKVTLENVSHQMKPRYSAFRASPFLGPTGCQAKMNAGEVRTVCRLENRRYGRLENLRYDCRLKTGEPYASQTR